jgi:hypothetical protein
MTASFSQARSGGERLRAILAALLKAVKRDLRSVGSFTGNNLFIAGLAFLVLKDPGVFATLTGFIGMVVFIPLSADPLRALPRNRLDIWPLSTEERRLLRILSPWLNPLTWLIAAMAFWKHVTVGLWALAGGVFVIGFLLPSMPLARKGMWRHLPSFPGPLNHLIRKDLRKTLSTLDFWSGALVAALSSGFRLAGLLPPEALLPLTILVILALSTYTQTLFGLDGPGGFTRYRLLPLRGWQILAAKDAAFLAVSVPMALPLAPVAGLAAALTALATGHYASVNHRAHQPRWRFSSGISGGASILQVVAMAAAAASTHAIPLLLVPCGGAYAWSTWRCGRAWEREQVG